MDAEVMTSNGPITKPSLQSAWDSLRCFTNARIAIGRSGCSVPTAPLLVFNLAHAQARDAVHQYFDANALGVSLVGQGFQTISVESAAPDRQTYLRRPDMGRKLSDESANRLREFARSNNCDFDLIFVIADGLSAHAAKRQAVPFLEKIIPKLSGFRIGPVILARQGRVALGDEIGGILRARLLVMLIGERPGLSSPDSLGIYLTYQPRLGRNDAERNCISNVRPEGLSFEVAAIKLHHLITESVRMKLTGVALKDDSDAGFVPLDHVPRIDT